MGLERFLKMLIASEPLHAENQVDVANYIQALNHSIRKPVCSSTVYFFYL